MHIILAFKQVKKKNYGQIKTAYQLSKNISSVLYHKIKSKDLPYILGGIGLILPIPFASVGGFFLGKIIYQGKKLYQTITKSNTKTKSTTKIDN